MPCCNVHDVYLMLAFCILFLDGIFLQDVMMLNFFPELSESEFSNNHEFVFVIDRSGLYCNTIPFFCSVGMTLGITAS